MEAISPSATEPAARADREPSVPFSIGQEVFERFTLLEHIGNGRCSTVWRAEDVRFSREVVLKIFRSSNPQTIEAEQKVWRELLRRVRGLNSPNIAATLEFVRDEHWIALSNPVVGGRTLASYLMQTGKPLPLAESEKILKAVGAAMVAAHEKGRILHGNLNGFNIFIKKDGAPKITDFGFHPPLQFENAPRTNPELTWKMACVSPERKGGGGPSPSDDLYAFAVVAVQLLTGTNPPEKEGKLDPKAVAETLTKISPKWSEPLSATLSENIEDRPTSFQLLLKSLGLMQEPPEVSGKDTPPKVPRKHKPRPGKNRGGSPIFRFLSLFCGLAVAIGIGWIIHQNGVETEKMQAERAAEEDIARKARLEAAKMNPPSEEITDVAPLKTTRKSPPTPEATPLKINSGALDFYREGRAKLQAGDPTGALQSYDLALILQSGWAELHEARAEAQIALNQLEDAVDEYTSANKAEPNRATALLGRAGVYLSLGHREKAQADFEAVISADPENAAAKAGREQLAAPKFRAD